MEPIRGSILIAALTCLVQADPTPVVLWHGMGDSCCNPLSMGAIKGMIEKEIEGVYVRSLMIGDDVVEDTENGFFKNVNKQVEMVCHKIQNDPKLANGYNSVGFSQGGQFFWIQNTLVQAEYWHDPMNEEEYKQKSIFIADINNEKALNATYKENLLKLENLVLVKFLKDTMVVPKESEWFGFYPENDVSRVLPYNETKLYTEDRIGLKELENSGRLHFLAVDGDHLRISEEQFKTEIIDKYLK